MIIGSGRKISSSADNRAKLKALLKNRALKPALYPASLAQERLWFLHQFEGTDAVFNMVHVLSIEGPLSVALLNQAITLVIERHETLRTSFVLKNDQVYQKVTATHQFSPEIIDLQGVRPTYRTDLIALIRENHLRFPFDLAQGPLLRVALLRLAPQSHLLLLGIHHINSDAWSMGVFLKEFAFFFEALLRGHPSQRPSLTMQYRDYAQWQRRRLTSERAQSCLAFWREQMRDCPSLTSFPSDYPRPKIARYRGKTIHFSISSADTAGIKHFSRRARVTPFMTLLGIFTVLIARHTHRRDLVIGTSNFNRRTKALEPMIGFFVSMLPLRFQITHEPSFNQLLLHIRQTLRNAYAYQDYPFENLIADLNPERESGIQPLFQTVFEMLNVDAGTLALPGLRLKRLKVPRETAKYDVLLSAAEEETCLHFILEYDRDLFHSRRMENLALQYQTLIKAMLAEPERSVMALPLLGARERRHLLEELNHTHYQLPELPVFQAFWVQTCNREPERTAVVCGNHHFTYRALDRNAANLAGQLRRKGLGPDHIAGIFGERGIEFFTAAIGIFKLAAAYLPLDIYCPPQRLGRMLADCRPFLVMDLGDLEKNLSRALAEIPLQQRPQRFKPRFHPESGLGATETAAETGAATVPQHLAYLIYTSGSTGHPKGAMVSQLGMTNHFISKLVDMDLKREDRVVQSTAQSFDISVWQLFAPSFIGATTCIFSDTVAKDPPRLLDLTDRIMGTVLEMVPSVLRAGFEAAGGRLHHSFSALSRLLLTGERVPPDLCEQWLAQYPQIPIINAYGPTECADDVTLYTLREDQVGGQTNIPIGLPLINMKVYVTDRQLQPMPTGTHGECLIGGFGLGRGYRRRPALTAASFIPNPFASNQGERLYKTGDVVGYRWGKQDQLELVFFGRLDFQVKIRGIRIEVGEIEAVMQQQSAIRTAAVAVKKDPMDQPVLTGYVVLHRGKLLAREQLLEHLRAKLPNYMVPRLFVWLTEMPLNVNGKLDRKALPLPQLNQARVMRPPENATQQQLADIWSDVLKRPRETISIGDNYFDLGGHSLSVTRLVARIQEKLGVAISISQVFQEPTIERLAVLIGRVAVVTERAQAPREMITEDEVEFVL